jgi:hypothetical protein
MNDLYRAVNEAGGPPPVRRPDGTVIHSSPSNARPGKTNIVVFAPREELVQGFLDQHAFRDFLPPVRCADGMWCSMGRAG